MMAVCLESRRTQHAESGYVIIVRLLTAVALYFLCLPGAVRAADADAVQLGIYALGAWPSDRGVFAQGRPVSDSRVATGFGAGIKATVFPHVLGGFIGLGVESFGHGTEIAFPSSVAAGTLAATNLWSFHTMLNGVVRYPLDRFIPYVGIGAGVSSGVLTHANIPGRSDRDFEGAWSFGHQFFGGLEVNLTRTLWVFGEYKYVSANYHWEQLALDYRAHYGALGVGLRF